MNTAQWTLALNDTPPAGPRFGRYVAAAALACAALLGVGAPALAVPPADIIVEDTAGILDQAKLVPAIEDTSFREPTTVAVFTERGEFNSNFNERVLVYARDQHQEWLSADGQKWADGLFIVAIDPEGRHVGTYMGEDRKVDPDDRAAIQGAAKDLLADAQWTDGAIAGVQEGAKLINRPWYLNPIAWAIAGGFVFMVGLWILILALLRRSKRRQCAGFLAQGDKSYTNVTMDLDVTELNARTIPADSPYGSLVLERYRAFRTSYAQLNAQRDIAAALTKGQRSAKAGVKVTEAYADSAVALDNLDDVIADSNALLNLGSSWATAWDNQTRDLREDLEGIDDVIAGSTTGASAPSAAALLSYRDQSLELIRIWGAGLADGSLTPDAALDALRAARSELSDLLHSHAEAMISLYAEDDEEKELMREALDETRQERMRPRSRRSSILTATHPTIFFWGASSIDTGYSAGQSSVSSARSSSSSGYGSSGGSFSGSGSSSHF